MEQNNSNQKVWYKKKRYIILLTIFGFILVLSLNNNSDSQIKSEPTTIPSYRYNTPVYQPTNSVNNLNVPQLKPQTTTSNTNSLSNDNYYTNVNENTVHSPAYSNSVPAGASAVCRDGTYSFSQNRRGTCSRHGGVAEWL
ncbi:hypothetical protein A3A07_03235 [Candidatus Nomurabacteria bacterium RIFCSPLOWO2_01_FULL_41_52]|nr:MAG: hypothetical protein A3F49_03100 [Candidatus Nomurabacteria bacterium RIFCSPHIGHO2_12_FULL_42_19]OGI93539.1 MAG: hypothetical protein A3A07_03235 [Candidatus Nomurabacteria bacterium RIFCSPLOWO2_01_FULL_41_52]OGI99792.1 MAG: hypothetical protein A3H56_03105 [Candidatus Nomurabacteria bacterium RIFCSPLOWO2_02_FULL_42_24]